MDKIDGKILLKIARGAIGQSLGLATLPHYGESWLSEPAATFVTLTRNGELRGCIGSIEAHRSLKEDVRENAVAAAFRDPRFPAVTAGEYWKICIEVSLLSALESMEFRDEKDALAQLRPGVDGLVFQCGFRRSTFLPQVWEKLPDPREFLEHLKQKAGFPREFWAPDVRLSRYTHQEWREEEIVKEGCFQ